MNALWIIDNSMDVETNNFVTVLDELHIEYKVTPYRAFIGADVESIATQNRPVICYGSVNFIKQIQRYCPKFNPGTYANFLRYMYHSYNRHFTEYLLNSPDNAITVEDLLKQETRDAVSNKLGKLVFIRPDRSDKPFSGQVIDLADVPSLLDKAESFGNLTKSDLVYLSAPQHISREARVLIVDDVVVTGSFYGNNGKVDANTDLEYLEYFMRFAKDVLKRTQYRPDKAFTLDICQTYSGEFKLVELSAFSCAGMYSMDYTKIVKAVSNLAVRDYVTS